MVSVVSFPSNPIGAAVVAVVLFLLGRVIIRRVAVAEGHPWLVNLLTASLIIHLVAAPAQIFVVHHFYGGIADWLRYDRQGANLAAGFRHFDFALAPGHLRGIVNDGSVSIAAAIVFTIVGTNQVAAFMVMSWLSFVGSILFFRAFTLTFPQAGHRRYAYMVFFLPSIVFWTADVSKESIMMLSLGVIAYGAAKILMRRRGGYSLATVGMAIGFLIRPNELLIALAGFAVALMVRPTDPRQNLGGLKRIAGLVFLGALLIVCVYLTVHYLFAKNSSLSLEQVGTNNSGTGAGFGSGGVPYSSSLAYFPHDVYVMLFDPLPINFHGFGELISAFENSLIVALIFASLRQLKVFPRAAFARPYIMMCAIYSIGFIYTFAALGNLGLITRERSILFPFLLVLLCVPRSPRRARPRYEWELRRRDRLRRRNAALAGRPVQPMRPVRPPPGGTGQRRPAARSPTRPR